MLTKPTLTFSTYAFIKMTYIARLADTEVGFWCLGRKDNPLYVEDINVIGQEANLTLNKFDDDALAEYMAHMHKQGYDLDQFALIWGHTHPKGCGAKPSSTDESTFTGNNQFGGKAKLVMFILSQSGDMYARLRATDPLLGRVETEMSIKIDFETEAIDDIVQRTSSIKDTSGEWAKSLELVAPLKVVYTNKWFNKGKGKIKSVLPPVSRESSSSFGKDSDACDAGGDDYGVYNHSTWDDVAYFEAQQSHLDLRDDPFPPSGPKTFGVESEDRYEDGFDMDPFYTLITCSENNKSVLISDKECADKFGCGPQDLEDIYLEVAAEIGEVGSAALLGICAKNEISVEPWVGDTHFVLADILKALNIHVKTGQLEEEAFILYLEDNGQTEAAADIRAECTWVSA
jgi:hypothetical protein